jgi:hypothetical protein
MAKCSRCNRKGLFFKVNPSGICKNCEILIELEAKEQAMTETIKKLDMELSDRNTLYNFTADKAKIEAIELAAEPINKILNEKNIESNKLDTVITQKRKEEKELFLQVENLKEQVVETKDEILLQSFGLYKPKYQFSTAELYKTKLEKIRENQKLMIKNNTAVTGNMNWTVNGSNSQGQKMVKDMQKLLLRAFNGECDEIVEKVKYNNFEASLKRITSSYEAISKLGNIMSVAVSKLYYDSKIDELYLSFEYQQKKQQEKEEQKALKEQLREEAKLQKEIEKEREKIEKEQNHYQSALSKIIAQFKTVTDEKQKAELENKKAELEAKLSDAEKALADVDYREANQKAGYVYIVSNIGAFGENIYKIGMTRRLDPTERIDELGSASVPFDFDIHAMIFCDNAPALETALHRAFENKKLNWVNTRREFFSVTLDEIKDVVHKNYDKTVEFIDLPDAEQYRVSQKMKEEK